MISNEFRDGRLSDTEVLLRPSRFTSEESFRMQKRPSEHQYQHSEVDAPLTAKEGRKSGGKRHLKFEVSVLL